MYCIYIARLYGLFESHLFKNILLPSLLHKTCVMTEYNDPLLHICAENQVFLLYVHSTAMLSLNVSTVSTDSGQGAMHINLTQALCALNHEVGIALFTEIGPFVEDL